MNALIDPRRYMVNVGGMTYPTPYREDSTSMIPTPMQKMLANFVQSRVVGGRNRDRIFADYGRLMQEVGQTVAGMKDVISEVCLANIAPGSDRGAAMQVYSRMQQRVDGLSFSPPAALRAPLAAQDAQTIAAEVNRGIATAWTQAFHFIVRLLDGLVDYEQVGLIDWSAPDVCAYHYFSHEHKNETVKTVLDTIQEQTGSRHREDSTVRYDRTEVKRHTRYEHDLVNARQLPIDVTLVPFRLERVRDKIPSAFRPFARIVTGNQIYDGVFDHFEVIRTSETVRESREWTDPPPIESAVYRYDPAIVLGPYVLGAWTEDEERKSREADRKISHLLSKGSAEQTRKYNLSAMLNLSWFQ